MKTAHSLSIRVMELEEKLRALNKRLEYLSANGDKVITVYLIGNGQWSELPTYNNNPKAKLIKS